MKAKDKADRCVKARELYQKATNSQRLYEQNADGTRRYLTDAETTAAREQAKTNWDESQKKYGAMMDPMKACDKDASVKAANTKMQGILKANMKPLMEALAGAAAGGATPTTPPAKKP